MDGWMLSIHPSSMMELRNYATTNYVNSGAPPSTYMGLGKDKQKSLRKVDQINHDVLETSAWSDEEVRILCLFVCSAFYCHLLSTK